MGFTPANESIQAPHRRAGPGELSRGPVDPNGAGWTFVRDKASKDELVGQVMVSWFMALSEKPTKVRCCLLFRRRVEAPHGRLGLTLSNVHCRTGRRLTTLASPVLTVPSFYVTLLQPPRIRVLLPAGRRKMLRKSIRDARSKCQGRVFCVEHSRTHCESHPSVSR